MFRRVIIFLVFLGLGYLNAGDEKPLLKPTPFVKVQQLIAKGKPLMLEFGAESCYSCRVMGQLLYEIKQDNPKSNIYFIDIYKDMQYAKKYKIRMIPTQLFLDKNGKILGKHIGIFKKEDLKLVLKEWGIL